MPRGLGSAAAVSRNTGSVPVVGCLGRLAGSRRCCSFVAPLEAALWRGREYGFAGVLVRSSSGCGVSEGRDPGCKGSPRGVVGLRVLYWVGGHEVGVSDHSSTRAAAREGVVARGVSPGGVARVAAVGRCGVVGHGVRARGSQRLGGARGCGSGVGWVVVRGGVGAPGDCPCAVTVGARLEPEGRWSCLPAARRQPLARPGAAGSRQGSALVGSWSSWCPCPLLGAGP